MTGGPAAVRSSALATAADQAIVSIVSFGTSLALVFFSTPEEFGRYSFLLSTFLLLAAAQNAGINTPTMVLSPRLEEHQRESFDASLRALLLAMSPVAILSGIWAALASGAAVHGMAALVVGAAYFALLLRDYFRTQEFARFRPMRAVKRDTGYAAVAIVGLASLVMSERLAAATAFGALGLAATIVVALELRRSDLSGVSVTSVRETLSRTWPLSRWGLIGATGSWMQTNSFVYLPFIVLGAADVATLAAARIVVMPAMLAAQSWMNTLRPLASRLIHEGELARVRTTVTRSVLFMAAGVAVYTAAAILLLNSLPETLLPIEYREIGGLVLVWAFIALVQLFRINAAAVLQAALAFKPLAMTQVAIAIYTVAATLIATSRLGAVGALWVLASAELLFAAVLWTRLASRFSDDGPAGPTA
jgi:O-antigen/teichoic acid export membrane protein